MVTMNLSLQPVYWAYLDYFKNLEQMEFIWLESFVLKKTHQQNLMKEIHL